MNECWKCNGTGLKPVKRKLFKGEKCRVCEIRPTKEKVHKPFRPFRTVVDKGPKTSKIEPIINQDEMLTGLCGHWMIFQFEYGHRMTVDDVCVGAIASAQDIKIETYLDLGTGLGSVLNIVNWTRHGEIKKAFAFEAQEKNYRLAKKTIQYNCINHIVDIMNLDMRTLCDGGEVEAQVVEKIGKVDLITGTPPYFPLDNKTLPDDVGRGMCAFEIRGGVEVYCEIASKFINKNGRFVIANGYLQLQRTLKNALEVGFVCRERYDIHGKEDKEPLFAVFCFEYLGLDFIRSSHYSHLLSEALSADDITRFDNDAIFNQYDKEKSIVKRINIRGFDCQFTKEYEELMASIGKPPVTFEIETIPHAQRDLLISNRFNSSS